MKHHLVRAVILASLLVAAPAYAQASAKVFLEKIDGPNEAESSVYAMNLNSFGTGFLWANAFAHYQWQKRFYCAPDNLVISSDQHASILREHVKRKPDSANTEAGLALLAGLIETFPCERIATKNPSELGEIERNGTQK